MKTIFLIIVFSLGSFFSVATSVDTVASFDSIKVENTTYDSILEGDNKPTIDPEKADANAEKNAQWFMYGFLVLGAVLVFWKLKNNK
jgi:hypothetical protein